MPNHAGVLGNVKVPVKPPHHKVEGEQGRYKRKTFRDNQPEGRSNSTKLEPRKVASGLSIFLPCLKALAGVPVDVNHEFKELS